MPIAADEKTRLKALTAYAITNSQVAAGEAAGVSNNAVSRWVADSPETLERIRRELQANFMPQLVDLGRMLLIKVQEAKGVEVKTGKDAQAFATAFGIIVDKMHVLLGIPNRVEYGLTVMHQVDESNLARSMAEMDQRMRSLQGPVTDIIEADFTPK